MIRLAQFHPSEFYKAYLLPLENQVENYIVDMRSNEEFFGLKYIGSLVEKLVKMKKNIVYPLVNCF